MSLDASQPLIIDGVDITHNRLVDLAKLADQAEAFYYWVEEVFQKVLQTHQSLNDILMNVSREEIQKGIEACYTAGGQQNLPLLFDGIGRSYRHPKACYYFFAWLIRDAPQQRLGPLVQRIIKLNRTKRVSTEIVILAALIYKYRANVRNFSWQAIREVIIDRLEGSRRSIKGHEKEAVVRTALLAAIQKYYIEHESYGVYSGIEIPEGQVTIGKETFDVSANLFDSHGKQIHRILVPIKTRETEGGGHAHLFTRDIMSAIQSARLDNPTDFVVAVIVARNWSGRETDVIQKQVDHAAIFDLSPNEFNVFSDDEQQRLNLFIHDVFSGTVQRGI